MIAPTKPQIFIYILKDPETEEIREEIRYVGKTENPGARFVYHCTPLKFMGNAQNEFGEWVLDLKTRGLKPIMEIIAQIETGDGKIEELYWIGYYADQGADLLNKMHFPYVGVHLKVPTFVYAKLAPCMPSGMTIEQWIMQKAYEEIGRAEVAKARKKATEQQRQLSLIHSVKNAS